MCGGAILADLIGPPRSRRLIADFLNFPDLPDDDDDDVKPFAYSGSKSKESGPGPAVDCGGQADKNSKRKRKNQYRGIRQRPWGKWEDVYPAKKVKPNSLEVAAPIGENNGVLKLSDELYAFETQMKFYETPYPEEDWDKLLNGDAHRDVAKPMNLWTFNGLTSIVGGIY